MYVGELRGREKLDYVRPTITDVAMRCNNMEYFLCLSFVGGRLEPTDRTQKSRGEKAARARTARRRRTLLRATAKVGAGSSFLLGCCRLVIVIVIVKLCGGTQGKVINQKRTRTRSVTSKQRKR